MKYTCLLTALFFLFGLAACEKGIDFKLNETAPKLVVEATIENGSAPIVVLTTSLDYFSNISPDILANSFVHNATVSITNGSKTHQLKEYRQPIAGGYNIYYYSNDNGNSSTAFVGELNKAYDLTISSNNQKYTAHTTIPNITKVIDSIWWKAPPNKADSAKAVVVVRATDPKGYGDYVRYFTKKNSQPFYPGINSVYDDLFIDGTTYELQVEPGFDRNIKRKDEDLFFARGDTVTLKLSNIDKVTYDFWRTMEYSYASVGNPFSTPTKVLGNISNGALGYFGGYASQTRSIIIPK